MANLSINWLCGTFVYRNRHLNCQKYTNDIDSQRQCFHFLNMCKNCLVLSTSFAFSLLTLFKIFKILTPDRIYSGGKRETFKIAYDC